MSEDEWDNVPFDYDDDLDHGPPDSDDPPDRDEYEPGGLYFEKSDEEVQEIQRENGWR